MLDIRHPLTVVVSALVLLSACPTDAPADGPAPLGKPDAVPWVDPMIGTANEGNTFPGAVVPFGMVAVSPHNAYSTPLSYLADEPIAPSGYVHGQPYLYGFGLTHLSGVGCPDLGVPVVVGTSGAVDVTEAGYRSAYSDEVAEPGYYAVTATDLDVTTEVTATERVGVFRFDFGFGAGGNVLVDPTRAVSWQRDNGSVTAVGERGFEGSVTTAEFCVQGNQQTVYFVGRFDRPPAEAGVDGQVQWFRFDDGPVTLSVGISYTSVAGARANLAAEVPEPSDFAAVRAAARDTWNDLLGRVRVEGASDEDRTILYTALYHSLIHPSLFSDHGVEPVRYHVYSLWDTYRTVHPLLTLIYPDFNGPLLRALADLTLAWNAPPKWELAGQEVQMMVGDPAAIVFADAWLKGLQTFDLEAIYPVLREAALSEAHRPGNVDYRSLGYVPMELAADLWGPVSTTLEYALADWAMARLAESLGRDEDVALFEAQALGYRALFDPETKLLRPTMADGSWFEPFDPDALQGSNDLYDPSGGPGFVEGTAWHYAFMAPHDIVAQGGLADLHGGTEAFVTALDSVFTTGRFVMWNEPDMGYPWLFARLPGHEERAPEEVRRTWERFFGTGPEGLPGNDDAGTLSAWLVFAALGLYPDNPAEAELLKTRPMFDRVELHVPGHEVQRL